MAENQVVSGYLNLEQTDIDTLEAALGDHSMESRMA